MTSSRRAGVVGVGINQALAGLGAGCRGAAAPSTNAAGTAAPDATVWPLSGKWHDGAVLGDDAVDEVQIAGDAPQLVEDAARHQQHE